MKRVRSMREECIALEAARLAARVRGRPIARPGEPRTYQEIADAAIDKVDAWASRGELGTLHYGWTFDSESA